MITSMSYWTNSISKKWLFGPSFFSSFLLPVVPNPLQKAYQLVSLCVISSWKCKYYLTIKIRIALKRVLNYSYTLILHNLAIPLFIAISVSITKQFYARSTLDSCEQGDNTCKMFPRRRYSELMSKHLQPKLNYEKQQGIPSVPGMKSRVLTRLVFFNQISVEFQNM